MNKILHALTCLTLLMMTGAAVAEPDSDTGTRRSTGSPSGARDWPVWSGPDGNLTSLDNGVFGEDAFGLERMWSRPLGSSYSGMVVVGDRLVTAFSDGEADYLVALDGATGVEQWRYRISDTYKGHDGSDDGPLASPAITDGVVYGLGAWGRLFAVSLADGKEAWAHDLVADFGAKKPEYGFTTTPAVAGDLLAVETGGDGGRSISAFDRHTGELRWSAGDDAVNYQSPMALEIGGEGLRHPGGGQTTLVAITNRHLLGLAPETGEVLWQHQHTEGDGNGFGFAQPVPVGEGGVLLADWPESALFRVSKGGGGYKVEEVWRSRALRGTYAVPVPYEGHLYGFAGNFLTCVDATTGETVWKSRPPGQGNLVLVDGHLVIQTRSGEIVVAEATPAGYRERTRVQALDAGYYTRPSFAGGRVYVRNLTGIAAVGVTEAGAAERTATSTAPPTGTDWEIRGDFGAFVEKLMAADNKTALIDRFLAEHPKLPIREGDLVHFVYRGEVDDLAISGNLFRDGREHPMHRVPGTDFYFLTVELPPKSHFTYRFSEFDQPMADPGNPHKVGPDGGEQSVLTTAGWQAPAHLREPEGERGRIEKLQWQSEMLGNEREVQVYLPAGYGESARRYPLLVVHHGDQALSMGEVDKSLDNLIGSSVAPLIAAFVPRNDWREYGGSSTADYARALAEELIPILDGSFRTDARPAARAVMGPGSAGFASIFAAVHHPATFGKAAAQSYYHGDLKDELTAAVAKREKPDLEFLFHWSTYDYRDPSRDFDARADAEGLVAALREKGYQPRIVEVDDGFGWGMWQARTGEILEALFPME